MVDIEPAVFGTPDPAPPDDPWGDQPPPAVPGAPEHPVIDERYDDLYLPRSALAALPRGEPLIDGILDRHTLFVVAGRDHTYKKLPGDLLAVLTGHRTPLAGP
jgi:hypothetical protein